MSRSAIPFPALLALAPLAALAVPDRVPEYSVAGFYPVKDSGRESANFNVGWRFRRGAVAGAGERAFDDRSWGLVNLPCGVDGALPEEASGCANYQGPAWYRKTFTPPDSLKGKRVTLHFEGILGKSEISVNGKLLRKHYSGFLPAIVDITDLLEFGKPNVVAVLADNSDDGSFPPGKSQKQLDYSYFGGIYRDVRLIATDPVHITDPNETDLVAGGGVFAHTESLSETEAVVVVKTDVANGSGNTGGFTIRTELVAAGGATTAGTASLGIASGKSATSETTLTVKAPKAWSPDSPSRYDLVVTVADASGKTLDAFRTKIGLRTIAMVPGKGLVLNGKPFGDKLIGANRHQDFAVLGFALPNATQRRDVQKLRDAGLRVIRSAHYPQDPAFMDACDELGMFVIVNTPGWQFWNKDPVFATRVYSDIRNMVRRDRNHPSVLLWEPILNETSYPADFAKNTHDITHAEYPYPGCYTAADATARGHEHFDVEFTHPPLDGKAPEVAPKKVTFTREWGDNVDDWSAHNSPSRAARGWGEVPQLVQAKHYAKPDYTFICWDTLHKAPDNHFGGTLWHSFDHQRGYHPDPFFGGIMDAFRQPKYSYELFRSQRRADLKLDFADSGPMVFIANAMTPFSPADVTVYSNCDEVRLTYNGDVVATKKVVRENPGMPSPITVFPGVFDFMRQKSLQRAGKQGEGSLFAEGLIDGKVVATHRVTPAKRADKVILRLDTAGVTPEADGSSVVTVVAAIADRAGNIKRLNDGAVRFEVTGEGALVGDASVGANPRVVRWGEAPALIRATIKPGKVRVVASYATPGAQMPATGVLEFETVAPADKFIQDEVPAAGATLAAGESEVETPAALRLRLETVEKELARLRNREVERQQTEFETSGKK